MLEKMDAFFAARVNGYDQHMKTTIKGADEFYPYTASLLPKKSGAKILDLGCGTGLELEEYYRLNSQAKVTGIDCSPDMLEALQKKFPEKEITCIYGSYLEEPFGIELFDAAVSVESLHHFPAEKKRQCYRKLHAALNTDGYFVLTDYFAESEKQEKENFEALKAIKQKNNLSNEEFYHYDTPLTVQHEREILLQAGFSQVTLLKRWGATQTLLAKR